MKIGTVIGVYLSDDEFDNLNSIIVNVKQGTNNNTIRCFPLTPNNRSIPIIGEQVYVYTAYDGESRGLKASIKNYYTTPIGLQGNINHNALPGGMILQGSPSINFSQVTNGIPIQSSTDPIVNLGNGFEEVPTLSQLQPFLGDIIYEGRFGQSIRFGYTPQNTKLTDNKIKGAAESPSWSSTEPKAPITIIRNGAGESNGYNKFVIEDVNEDDSSIWLGSKQTISLKSSNNFTLGVTPPSNYKSPQIVLNSDRIVLNSKSDSVLISGGKSVNVSTPNWKADMDVIFTQLEAITDALSKLAPALTSAIEVTPAGPAPIASLASAGPQLASAAAGIKTQLQLMKQ